MDCQDWLKRSVLRLVGEVPEQEYAALDEHLKSCPSCAARWEEMNRDWQALGTYDGSAELEQFRTKHRKKFIIHLILALIVGLVLVFMLIRYNASAQTEKEPVTTEAPRK